MTGLSGCGGSGRSLPFAGADTSSGPARSQGKAQLARADYATVYARLDGERYPVEAFDFETVDPAFLRQQVAYAGLEPAGTIVVDPKARFLYRVENGRRGTDPRLGNS